MVCQCILDTEDGSNDFQLPHVNKESMEKKRFIGFRNNLIFKKFIYVLFAL